MVFINQIMCPFPLNILMINRPILTKIRDEIKFYVITNIIICLKINIVCIFDYIICTR